jgi:uncharacterized protein YecE (DUF72 family)
MHQKSIWVGTSGWSYREWKPGFYPRGTKAGDYLAYYATRFSTVEVNGSFYRLPPEKNIRRWCDAVPEGFRFALKAWQGITHHRRLQHCASEIASQQEIMEAFGGKLGPVLFQLPPTLEADEALLDDFLAQLPRGYDYVVEFRHASWLHRRYYDVLARRHAALCRAHYREWKPAHLPVHGPFIYVRLHGPEKLYAGSYGEAFLRTLAHRLRDSGKPGYVYFNNTMHGDAIWDAEQLLSMI